MRSFDVNIKPQPRQSPSMFGRPKKKRRLLKFFVIFVILIGIGWVSSKLLSKTNQIFTNKQNIFMRAGKLIIGGDKTLIGEDEGFINILLLGMGGPGHDGPLLTDTMIVANLNVKTSEVVLISIPRDFIAQLPNQGFRKINAAYAFAEAAEPGSGGLVAAGTVEKITGMTIPYYVSIDFKGFVKAVDHVGGLDVTVEKTFTDAEYPDEKNWYLKPVTFTAGPEHMNGNRALIFARSRHGTNSEGSDFARSERQKKIILAFKDKVAKLNLGDVKTLNNLMNDFAENVRTNLEPYEIKHLAELARDIKAENVYSLSLAPAGNLICDGIIGEYENRAYVIQPCEGKTLSDIHEFLSDVTLVAKIKKEEAKIEVQNSTGKSYVLDSWRALQNAGFDITLTTFKSRTPYDRTILYDNSEGIKPKTLEYLKDNFNFTKADIPYSQSNADFVIILGLDSL